MEDVAWDHVAWEDVAWEEAAFKEAACKEAVCKGDACQDVAWEHVVWEDVVCKKACCKKDQQRKPLQRQKIGQCQGQEAGKDTRRPDTQAVIRTTSPKAPATGTTQAVAPEEGQKRKTTNPRSIITTIRANLVGVSTNTRHLPGTNHPRAIMPAVTNEHTHAPAATLNQALMLKTMTLKMMPFQVVHANM